MSNSISGIYVITNTVNGHQYIGSTVNVNKRWSEHLRTLRLNKHHNRYLQKAFNKYGENAFKFSILEQCFVFALIFREQYYIDSYLPEYNLATKAGSTLGIVFTSEARAKLSSILKGRKQTPEHIAKRTATRAGKKVSAETRAKISASVKASMTPEHRAHLSATTKASMTPEHRAKLSALKKGKKLTPEHRAKISASSSIAKLSWWANKKQKQDDK